MFKKVLSLAVCVCMLLGVIGTMTLAATPLVSTVEGMSASVVEFTDGTNIITNLPASGTVVANVKVSNSSNTAKNVLFLVGVFTNNVMVDMQYAEQSINAGASSVPMSVALNGVARENTVLKAYVWNSFLNNHAIAYTASFPSSDCSVLSFKIDGKDLSSYTKVNGMYSLVFPKDTVPNPKFDVIVSDNATTVYIPPINVPCVAPVEVRSSDGTVEVYKMNVSYQGGHITDVAKGKDSPLAAAPVYAGNDKFLPAGKLYTDRDQPVFQIAHPSQALYGNDYIMVGIGDVRNVSASVADFMNGSDKEYFTFSVDEPCEVYAVSPFAMPGYPARGWTAVNSGDGLPASVTYNGTSYSTSPLNNVPVAYSGSTPAYYATRAQFSGANYAGVAMRYVYKLTVTAPGKVSIPTPGGNVTPTNGGADNGVFVIKWTSSGRTISSNADLASLEYTTAGASAGTKSVPKFSAGVNTYNVLVPEGTTSVTLKGIQADQQYAKSVTYDKASLTSFPGSIKATVTAEDGTTKVYTVNFASATLSTNATLTALTYTAGAGSAVAVPNFNSATNSYNVELPIGTTTVKITGSPAAGATVVYDKASLTTFPGSIKATVTAEDNTTKKDYTVNFTVKLPSTDATLTALTYTAGAGSAVAVPGFAAATGSYNVELPAGTTTVKITGTPATGATVAYDKASLTSFPGSIKATVTAEDGTTKKEYTVNFTVAATLSTDATLTALTYTAGAGSAVAVPGFAAATGSYNVELPVGTTTVKITGTPAAGATVAYDKASLTSFPGSIKATVTAQDGVTKKDYTVNFTVAVANSTDATLKSLSYKVGGVTTAVPGFAAATGSYNVELPAGTAGVELVAVTNHSAAIVGYDKTSLTAFPGSIKATVTAQDGTTKKEYTVNFTVASSGGGYVGTVTDIHYVKPDGTDDSTVQLKAVNPVLATPVVTRTEGEWTEATDATLNATYRDAKFMVYADRDPSSAGGDGSATNKIKFGNTGFVLLDTTSAAFLGEGATLVTTRNDDKGRTDSDTAYRFTINKPATVYVSYYTAPDAAPAGWEKENNLKMVVGSNKTTDPTSNKLYDSWGTLPAEAAPPFYAVGNATAAPNSIYKKHYDVTTPVEVKVPSPGKAATRGALVIVVWDKPIDDTKGQIIELTKVKGGPVEAVDNLKFDGTMDVYSDRTSVKYVAGGSAIFEGASYIKTSKEDSNTNTPAYYADEAALWTTFKVTKAARVYYAVPYKGNPWDNGVARGWIKDTTGLKLMTSENGGAAGERSVFYKDFPAGGLVEIYNLGSGSGTPPWNAHSIVVVWGEVKDDPKSTNALLSTLTYKVGAGAATTVTGFAPADTTKTYAVTLAAGTTSVSIDATAADSGKASVVFTPSGKTVDVSSGSGTAKVDVTAEDGVTKNTYTVNFTVTAPAGDSDDSTLKSLSYKINGGTAVALTNFSPERLRYNITVPASTTSVDIVELLNNPAAQVSIKTGKRNMTSFPAEVGLRVTAEDGSEFRVYHISVSKEGASNPTLSVSNATGNVGDEVTVTLDIANNPGINQFGFGVVYDTTKFECTSATVGTVPIASVQAPTKKAKADATYEYLDFSEARIAWIEESGVDNNKNGTIMTLKFKILPGVANGQYILDIVHRSDVQNDAYEGINTKLVPGTITVGSGQPKSNDATLKSLSYKVGGVTTAVPGFAAATGSYNVELPTGTTSVELIGAANHAAAVVTYDKASLTSFPGSIKATVKAEDGVTTKEYTVNFTVAPVVTNGEVTSIAVNPNRPSANTGGLEIKVAPVLSDNLNPIYGDRTTHTFIHMSPALKGLTQILTPIADSQRTQTTAMGEFLFSTQEYFNFTANAQGTVYIISPGDLASQSDTTKYKNNFNERNGWTTLAKGVYPANEPEATAHANDWRYVPFGRETGAPYYFTKGQWSTDQNIAEARATGMQDPIRTPAVITTPTSVYGDDAIAYYGKWVYAYAKSFSANTPVSIPVLGNHQMNESFAILIKWGPSTLPASSNANLYSLTYKTNGGTDTAVPGFSGDGTSYTVSLPTATTSVSLKGEAFSPYATVSYDKASLDLSTNKKGSIVVTVTAQDGTTKKYTVNFDASGSVITTLSSVPKTPDLGMTGLAKVITNSGYPSAPLTDRQATNYGAQTAEIRYNSKGFAGSSTSFVYGKFDLTGLTGDITNVKLNFKMKANHTGATFKSPDVTTSPSTLRLDIMGIPADAETKWITGTGNADDAATRPASFVGNSTDPNGPITWKVAPDNKDPNVATRLATVTVPYSNTDLVEYSVDLTDYVVAHKAAGATTATVRFNVPMYIYGDSTGSYGTEPVFIISKAADAPALQVTTATGSPVEASTNANLTYVTIGGGQNARIAKFLAFDPTVTTAQTFTIDAADELLPLNIVAADAKATVAVNGGTAVAGQAIIDLSTLSFASDETLTIVVKAASGATKTYTVILKGPAPVITAGTISNIVVSPSRGSTNKISAATAKFVAGEFLYSDREAMTLGHVSTALNGADYIMLPLNDVRIGETAAGSGIPSNQTLYDFMNGDNEYFTFNVDKPCKVYVLAPSDRSSNYTAAKGWTNVNSKNLYPVTVEGTEYKDIAALSNLDFGYKPSDPAYYVTRVQWQNHLTTKALQIQGGKTMVNDKEVSNISGLGGLRFVYEKTVSAAGTVSIPTPGTGSAGWLYPDQMVVAVVWSK